MRISHFIEQRLKFLNMEDVVLKEDSIFHLVTKTGKKAMSDIHSYLVNLHTCLSSKLGLAISEKLEDFRFNEEKCLDKLVEVGTCYLDNSRDMQFNNKRGHGSDSNPSDLWVVRIAPPQTHSALRSGSSMFSSLQSFV